MSAQQNNDTEDPTQLRFSTGRRRSINIEFDPSNQLPKLTAHDMHNNDNHSTHGSSLDNNNNANNNNNNINAIRMNWDSRQAQQYEQYYAQQQQYYNQQQASDQPYYNQRYNYNANTNENTNANKQYANSGRSQLTNTINNANNNSNNNPPGPPPGPPRGPPPPRNNNNNNNNSDNNSTNNVHAGMGSQISGNMNRQNRQSQGQHPAQNSQQAQQQMAQQWHAQNGPLHVSRYEALRDSESRHTKRKSGQIARPPRMVNDLGGGLYDTSKHHTFGRYDGSQRTQSQGQQQTRQSFGRHTGNGKFYGGGGGGGDRPGATSHSEWQGYPQYTYNTNANTQYANGDDNNSAGNLHSALTNSINNGNNNNNNRSGDNNGNNRHNNSTNSVHAGIGLVGKGGSNTGSQNSGNMNTQNGQSQAQHQPQNSQQAQQQMAQQWYAQNGYYTPQQQQEMANYMAWYQQYWASQAQLSQPNDPNTANNSVSNTGANTSNPNTGNNNASQSASYSLAAPPQQFAQAVGYYQNQYPYSYGQYYDPNYYNQYYMQHAQQQQQHQQQSQSQYRTNKLQQHSIQNSRNMDYNSYQAPRHSASKHLRFGRYTLHAGMGQQNMGINLGGRSGATCATQDKTNNLNNLQNFNTKNARLRWSNSKKHRKKDSTKHFLREYLQTDDLLFGGMTDKMINDLVEVMYRIECDSGDNILEPGNVENIYFVIQSGAFNISRNNGDKYQIESPCCYGALDDTYICTSVVTASTKCIVWALDKRDFDQIKSQSSHYNENVEFLQSNVRIFNHLHSSQLVDILAVMTEKQFEKNDVIVQQGDDADEFFVIRAGTAVAIIKRANGDEEKVKEYKEGDYFGERGLHLDTKRAASIVATSSVKCYVVSKDDFINAIAPRCGADFDVNLNDCNDSKEEESKKDDDNSNSIGSGIVVMKMKTSQDETISLRATPIGMINPTGQGQIIKYENILTKGTFVAKEFWFSKMINKPSCLRREIEVLKMMDNDKEVRDSNCNKFIVKMYGQYRTSVDCGIIMECCNGGDLHTFSKRGDLSEHALAFIAVNVGYGLKALHMKNNLFRDLKPGNLGLTEFGYVKLLDMGLAMNRNEVDTQSGTDWYLPPEIVLDQHDRLNFGFDWWSLGVTLYLLKTKTFPFQNENEIVHSDVPVINVKVSKSFEELIKKLLHKNPNRRLGACANNGYKYVMAHDFFSNNLSGNWETQILEQRYPSPLLTQIQQVSTKPPLKDAAPKQMDLNHPKCPKWLKEFGI